MSPEALGEEGLDDVWDPAEERSPRPNPNSQPRPNPLPSLSNPEPFPTADSTFRPSPFASRKHRQGAAIPDNTAVDQGIKNIQAILHPPRKTLFLVFLWDILTAEAIGSMIPNHLSLEEGEKYGRNIIRKMNNNKIQSIIS